MTDCHTHTAVSPDGYDNAEATYRQACRLGLKAVAVTEHVEANRPYGPENYTTVHTSDEHYFYNHDIFNRSMEVNSGIIKKADSDTLFINGVELGQATHNFEFADLIADDERTDFIIGSMHELRNRDDFAFLNYHELDINAVLDEYFDEILQLCRWGRFDTLGHLTYPLRYICGDAGTDVNMTVFHDKIREIFRELASADKGLEINTSGLRQKYGKTFPDAELLKLYREYGGKIITLGSDAHRTCDIGKGISEGAEMASCLGFTKIYYFRKHVPYGIRI